MGLLDWRRTARPRRVPTAQRAAPPAYTPLQQAEILAGSCREGGEGARALFTFFLSFMAFALVTANAVDDVALLIGRGIALPLIGVEVSLLGFFWLAPFAVFVFHFWILLHFSLLAEKAYALRDAAEKLDADSHRFIERRLDNFTLFQAIVTREPGVFRGLLWSITYGTIVLMPLATLLYLQLRFLPYHDLATTWWHRTVVMVDVVLLAYLWPITRRRAERSLGAWTCRAGTKILLGWNLGLVLALLGHRGRLAVARWFWNTTTGRAIAARVRAESWDHRGWSAPRGVADAILMIGALAVSLVLATVPGEPLARLAYADREQPSPAQMAELLIASAEEAAQPMTPEGLQFKERLSKVDPDELSGAMVDEIRRMMFRGTDVRRIRAVSDVDERMWAPFDRGGMRQPPALHEVANQVRGLPFRRNLELRNRVIGPPDPRKGTTETAAIVQLDLSRRDLRYANFSGASISDARMDLADLRGAAFIGARLERVSMRGAALQGARLARASLRDVVLDAAIAPDSNWDLASLRDVSARGISLRGAQLEHVALELVDFGAAEDAAATFNPESDMTGTVLNARRAFGVSFAHARLEFAQMIVPATNPNFHRSPEARESGAAALDFRNAKLDLATLSAGGTDGVQLPARLPGGFALVLWEPFNVSAELLAGLRNYLADPPRRDDRRSWYTASAHGGVQGSSPTDPLAEITRKLVESPFGRVDDRRRPARGAATLTPVEAAKRAVAGCIPKQFVPGAEVVCRVPTAEATMQALLERFAALLPCGRNPLPQHLGEAQTSGIAIVDNTAWRLWFVLAQRFGEGVWRDEFPMPGWLDPLLRPGRAADPPVLSDAERRAAAAQLSARLTDCLGGPLAARLSEALFLKDRPK